MDVDVGKLIGLVPMDNIGIWEVVAVNVAKNVALVEPLRIWKLARAVVEVALVNLLLLVKETLYGTPVNANVSLNAFLLFPVIQGRPGTS